MHAADSYDDRNAFDDELPELPIPRPGEAADRAQPAAPLATPSLGGGASFTSVETGEARPEFDDVQDEAAAATEADERFTWELAARLTAGMLANPVRSNSSVKDAMGVFDQFLQEMHAYVRLTADFGSGPAQRRNAERQADFHTGRDSAEASDAPRAPGTPSAAPAPAPRPAPSLPRPAAGYVPIPPGPRYVPGSMAGPPAFDANVERDEDVA
jgi:hypothetical protein